MLYRTIPKNGDQLSILGFGCMRLPSIDRDIDEERAGEQVRRAIDMGVNYLDTAYPYHLGKSEPFLGRALADGYRDKVRLATKMPPWLINGPEDMKRIFNIQLKRLNTDRIDYYLIHGLEGENWPKIKEMGVLDFMEGLKKDGRILNAGFSFHGDKDAFKEITGAYDWEICLIQYNFLDEDNQAGTEGLEYAASRDLGVIVMEPLRGGNLTGRIPGEVQAIWDEAEIKRTPAEWALRWVWNRPEVTCVLSGMGEEEHIEENLRIAGNAQPDSLTQDELQLVKRAAETYRKVMKVGCTGCGYCIPCPEGVNIPECFKIYNDKHAFNDPVAAVNYILHVRSTTHGTHSASLCVNCGECVDKCPQHLPIPELLEEVAAEFEGPEMESLAEMVNRAMRFRDH
jgi:predicted aldo/keto reductase-like oxidoreductase